VVLKEPMSLEAFLDWESRQEFKYEFDGFQPVAMVGVTTAHWSTIRSWCSKSSAQAPPTRIDLSPARHLTRNTLAAAGCLAPLPLHAQ
jgi:hypothetical protein